MQVSGKFKAAKLTPSDTNFRRSISAGRRAHQAGANWVASFFEGCETNWKEVDDIGTLYYIYYLYIIYILFIYYLYIIYILFIYYLYIIYILFIYYLYIIYILFIYYLYIIYILFIYYLYIIYILFIYYLYIIYILFIYIIYIYRNPNSFRTSTAYSCLKTTDLGYHGAMRHILELWLTCDFHWHPLSFKTCFGVNPQFTPGRSLSSSAGEPAGSVQGMGDRSPFPIGWLMKKEGFVYPFNNREMMIDGIFTSSLAPSIFTKPGQYWWRWCW